MATITVDGRTYISSEDGRYCILTAVEQPYSPTNELHILLGGTSIRFEDGVSRRLMGVEGITFGTQTIRQISIVLEEPPDDLGLFPYIGEGCFSGESSTSYPTIEKVSFWGGSSHTDGDNIIFDYPLVIKKNCFGRSVINKIEISNGATVFLDGCFTKLKGTISEGLSMSMATNTQFGGEDVSTPPSSTAVGMFTADDGSTFQVFSPPINDTSGNARLSIPQGSVVYTLGPYQTNSYASTWYSNLVSLSVGEHSRIEEKSINFPKLATIEIEKPLGSLHFYGASSTSIFGNNNPRASLKEIYINSDKNTEVIIGNVSFTALNKITLTGDITLGTLGGNMFPSLKEIGHSGGKLIATSNAFQSVSALSSLSLSGVLEANDGAFKASGLSGSLTVPQSSKIYGSAFNNCTKLTSITMGDNVNLVPSGPLPFDGCTSVKSLTVGNNSSITIGTLSSMTSVSLGDDVIFMSPPINSATSFTSGENLEIRSFYSARFDSSTSRPNSPSSEIMFPPACTVNVGSFKSIGDLVFANNTSISSITLSNDPSVTIGKCSFWGCTTLNEISSNEYVTIERSAFEGSGITNVTLSKGGLIGSGSFYGTPLSSMNLNGEITFSLACLEGTTSLTTLNTPNNSIFLRYALSGSSLQSISIGGESIVSGEYGLYSDKIENITFRGSAYICEKGVSGVVVGPELLKSVNFLDDGTEFPSSLYKRLFSVDFPYTVKYPVFVDKMAFMHCESLTDVNIENDIHINDGAFNGCISLDEIRTEKTVTLGTGVFSGCTNIHYFGVGAVDVSEPQWLGFANNFYNTKNLIKIKVGSFVQGDITTSEQSFGDYSFEGSGIVAFDVVDSGYNEIKTKIESLENCNRLKSILLRLNKDKLYPEGSLPSLPNFTAFSKNGFTNGEMLLGKVVSVQTVPNKRKAKVIYKIADVTKEISVEVGAPSENITASVDDITCDFLGTDIDIGLKLTSVTGTVQSEVSDDSWISESNGVITVGINETSDNKWGWVLYRNNVGNYLLVSIKQAPTDGQIIDQSYILISETDRDTVLGLKAGFSGNILIIPETKDNISIKKIGNMERGQIIRYVVIPRSITVIGDSAFEKRGRLEGVKFLGNEFINIGRSAFSGCTNLKSIDIPYGAYIGDYSFKDCESLTQVDIPGGIESIGGYAFYGCASLLKLTISEGVRYIHNYAFFGSPLQGKLELPSTIVSVGYNSFRDCYGLEELIIKSGEMGQNSFLGCRSLKTVSILEGVTALLEDAFANCRNLVSVIIPSTVKEVGRACFRGCTSLSYVLFKGNAVPEPKRTSSGELTKDVFQDTQITEIHVYEDSTGWGSTWSGVPIVRIPRN